MREDEFRDKLIQDWKRFKDRNNVVNLHGGTFELIIESNSVKTKATATAFFFIIFHLL